MCLGVVRCLLLLLLLPLLLPLLLNSQLLLVLNDVDDSEASVLHRCFNVRSLLGSVVDCGMPCFMLVAAAALLFFLLKLFRNTFSLHMEVRHGAFPVAASASAVFPMLLLLLFSSSYSLSPRVMLLLLFFCCVASAAAAAVVAASAPNLAACCGIKRC